MFPPEYLNQGGPPDLDSILHGSAKFFSKARFYCVKKSKGMFAEDIVYHKPAHSCDFMIAIVDTPIASEDCTGSSSGMCT